MPRGYPRFQRKIWWETTPKGQLILLCKRLGIPLIQDFKMKYAECRIGKIKIVSINDDEIEIYRDGELVKRIVGAPMRINLIDGKTIVFETREKRFKLSFTRPLVSTKVVV